MNSEEPWNLPWCYQPRLISLGGWSRRHRSPGLLRLPGARTVSSALCRATALPPATPTQTWRPRISEVRAPPAGPTQAALKGSDCRVCVLVLGGWGLDFHPGPSASP